MHIYRPLLGLVRYRESHASSSVQSCINVFVKKRWMQVDFFFNIAIADSLYSSALYLFFYFQLARGQICFQEKCNCFKANLHF